VKTFEEAYCEHHRCTPVQFRRRVFWTTLHRHALPLAPWLLFGGYFAPEYELIAGCGRAEAMRHLVEELEVYRVHHVHSSWLRQRFAIRVSARRLRRIARDYLPGAGLPAPFSRSEQDQ